MAAEKEEDLGKFLNNVDEITRLVQGLNSEDLSVREKAICEADRRIASGGTDVEGCRTKVNKTSFNTSQRSQPPPLHEMKTMEMSQDGFLAALEEDARERAERRKENEILANALKDMGNEAFAKGDYETAVLRYSEGLNKRKDMQLLYTNRAQAHIKLEKYKEAITDCEWALRCNEKCVKAYVHMGKAYLGLKDYCEARNCYRKILEIDHKQEKLAKGYLNQVDFQEQKEAQEERARAEFALGKETAVSVKKLLQQLSCPDQMVPFYAGGIQLLTAAMEDCTEQTLFRTNNGFSVICDNKVIGRCLDAAGKDPDEEELCVAVLHLWQEVCKGNEENQRMLITHPDTDRRLLGLLSSGGPDVQHRSLALIGHLSRIQSGKLLLLSHLDLTRMLQCLLGLFTLSDTRAKIAIGLLAEFAVEEKFKAHVRASYSTAALSSFVRMLKNIKLVSPAAQPECIAIMLNLSVDTDIRRQMSNSEECWDACLASLDECQLSNNEADCTDTLCAVLSLMLNIALEPTAVITERAVAVTHRCLALLSSKNGGILTKTVGVLSRVLKLCPLAVDEVVRGGAVKKLMHFLKLQASGQIISRYAINALAACTRSSAKAREDVVESDKKFIVLMKLLRSENEVIAGNAALCLGYCVTVPGAAASMLKSDILKVLLTYARGDPKEVALQQNAAIALGKLCTTEPRYIEQLRELNGIEILNSCMKYVELL